ncbi:helix-turn-helix domain-containing protein [Lentilactobacillus buchneri]|uniref:helix-turn-helix domain-containing protein n=1 Tax=Lentilactobacillus buchneri TaxID=1581 RepID=UPI0021A5F02C|nr:helix-turn-helix transcriptional regulator [Lentilactobacillus buchneri]MCT2882634.1 XRE family transcriptional regulator [Lentilactobacillus buchneri]
MNDALRSKRQSKGMTMQDMANHVGISKSYYSLIERGERRVSYELTFKIANALNTTPDNIFLDFQSTLSKHSDKKAIK